MENIIAEIQVSYHSTNKEKLKISSSKSAFEILLSNWNNGRLELQEEFKVILLNRSNIVLGIYSLSMGGTSSTVVDIKLIVAVAIKCNASGIILCHNHPSGNLKPSKADIDLTTQIINACNIINVTVHDHVIIGGSNYYSFKSNMLL